MGIKKSLDCRLSLSAKKNKMDLVPQTMMNIKYKYGLQNQLDQIHKKDILKRKKVNNFK